LVIDEWRLLIVEGKILVHHLINETAAIAVRFRPRHVPTSQINNRHSSITNQPHLSESAKPTRAARPYAVGLERT
jgi:hypothetical protein